MLATSEPETTITIDQQVDMGATIANWELPDPLLSRGFMDLSFHRHHLELNMEVAVSDRAAYSPIDITASRNDSSITVSWTAPTVSVFTDPISGYVVDAYRTTNRDINSGSCITESTTCTITDLLPGYEYDIEVRSINKTGSSEAIGYTVPIFDNTFNQGKANLKDIPESNDNFGAVIRRRFQQ